LLYLFACHKAATNGMDLAGSVRERLQHIEDPLALLAGLFSFAPVGFEIYDARGHTVLVNQAFRDIFGSEPPPGYCVFDDEIAQQQGLTDLIRRAFDGETVFVPAFWYDPRELEHVAVSEGRRVAIEIMAFPIFDRGGAVGHVAFVFKDVTQDMQQRAEHEALTARLQLILDRMPIGCILGNADFRFTYWNPAAERIFGFAFEEVRDRGPFGLITPASAEPLVREIFDRLARGGKVADATAENTTKDGRTILCEWHNTALHDAAGRFIGVLSMCQDVTERRRIEAQLAQAQKMEAVGQLTGGIAHDFNNLLTVILGNLESAGDHAGDPVQRGLIESAVLAGERGAELVQRLLAFARRQILQPSILDINEAVGGLTGMLRRTLGEHVEIETAVRPGLWPTLVDRAQFENALINLAVNARDAMARGGKLTIETANVHLDSDYAAQNVDVTPGDYVLLAVTDTGTGMSPEVLARALEPFFTTKEVGRGSGLGLPMIFGFVKQSDGHMKIYSEVGHGTTVRIYLPRADTAKPAHGAAVASEEELPGGSETILVVEDDEGVRSLAMTQLKALGYRVLEARDGPSAESILRGSEPVDLLFTDVVMPGGMTGSDLATRARAWRPAMKVLYTTGYTENSVVHQGKLDPGVRLLSKPYRKRNLARIVREVLDGVR
jgi:PAS domain S-box-containing protein